MRRAVTLVVGVLVVALLGAGCTGGDDEGQTEPITTASTEAGDGSGTTLPGDGGNGSSSVTTSTTTTTVDLSDLPSVPRYEIVARTPASDGDIVVVELDPSSYDSLTNIDLQNVLADVVERHPPVLEAYVVDSPEAAQLVLQTGLTSEQETVLDEHHFVRLEEGFRMVFVGPFSDVGELILGS